MNSLVLLWQGFHVKPGKLHCPKFSPTRHHSRLSGCHHSSGCSCYPALCVWTRSLYLCRSQTGCRPCSEAGWISSNEEADWAASQTWLVVQIQAHPGFCLLLQNKGWGGLSTTALKKPEYIDGFDLNFIPLVWLWPPNFAPKGRGPAQACQELRMRGVLTRILQQCVETEYCW